MAQQRYRDLNLSFVAHPVTGDIGTLDEISSIKFSVRNILSTNFGERQYRYRLGSDVWRNLFSPNDSVTRLNMERAVREALQNHEPRVRLSSIETTQYDHELRLKVNYRIVGLTEVYSTDITLRKVR